MGQFASKLKGHVVTRTAQRFNIESRTDKILKQEKPSVAPRYPADQKAREDLLRDMPGQTEEAVHRKNIDLHDRLKEVYVTSQDPSLEAGFDPDINRRRPQNPDRPLPKARSIRGRDRSAFAIDETERNIRKGKISLEKVQEMIATHRADQEKHTPRVLAQFYNLDLAQTESILEHFRVYSHVQAKFMSAKERRDREDPYRAQPDWVEAAGEHPPILTDDQIPRAGVLPSYAPSTKPLVMQRENKIAIEPGSNLNTEKLTSGSEQVPKLTDSQDKSGNEVKK